MDLAVYLKERLLPSLTRKTVIFFASMCILTLILYAAGIEQDFADTTQIALLRIYVFLGVFLTAASISGTILDIIRFTKLKKPSLLVFAGIYAVSSLLGIATILAALFIIAFSGGTLPGEF